MEAFPVWCLGGHVRNDTQIPCYINLLSSKNGRPQEELEQEIVCWVADVACFLVVLRDLRNQENHESCLTLNLYGQIGSFLLSDNCLEIGKNDMPGQPW